MPSIETTITAVTVFTANRARITRNGKLTLTEGEHTITLANLPITLEEDSVRVSGRGEGVRILSVETKFTTLTTSAHEDLASLQVQLQSLYGQDRALIDHDKSLESRLKLLDEAGEEGGESFARMIAYKRAGFEDLSSFSAYLGEEQDKLRASQREILVQREDLAKEIEAMKQRINQFHHGNPNVEHRREIQVLVNVSAPTTFEMEAIYAVTNASWQPYYDVRLTENDVELTYLATVTQHSGEDWRNVSLALSTARPAVSTTLPELHPQYIAPFIPRPRFQAQEMDRTVVGAAYLADEEADFDEMPERTMAKKGGFGGMRMRQAAPPPKAAVMQATIEPESNGSGAALTYRIPAPATITSDGTPYKATVTIQRLSVKLDYFTIPKLAEEAYLRATITNTSAFTLLPGVVSIFHGAEFVGKTHIKTIAPNEEFEAQLGVDDRIKVKRELLQRDVSKKFIGSSRLIQFAYKISLTNLTDAPAKITVNDQLPLSQNERIQVKLLSATPAISEQDKLNILTWTLNLKPKEKQEITFTYTVEHPRDMEVTGLG